LLKLEKVKSECKDPSKVTIFIFDLSKPDEFIPENEKFLEKLENEGKKIDIMIENAGISQRSKAIDFDLENHLFLTMINYSGPVNHTKLVVRHMIRCKNPG